jgi:hypothetical protein
MSKANPPPSSGSLSTNRPVKRGSNRILERWFVAPAMFRADALFLQARGRCRRFYIPLPSLA